MFFSYEEFIEKLKARIKTGDELYIDLLETLIDSPSRYCGVFRLSNAKTKLIQNVTQSIEIKFGDFMEDIATEYIEKLGYNNEDKEVGCDENGDRLCADQVFKKGNTIFLVEQKIRDDHDSTKKRGQYSNFEKKLRALRIKYPSMHINASMWFVDDGLKKNRNYYQKEMDKSSYDNTELHLFYGEAFFESLDGGIAAWNEITSYLKRNKIETSKDIISIPDFGNSKEIYEALLKLPEKYWKKLLSKNKKYEAIRNEIFSSGDNLKKAMEQLHY